MTLSETYCSPKALYISYVMESETPFEEDTGGKLRTCIDFGRSGGVQFFIRSRTMFLSILQEIMWITIPMRV